MWTRGHGFNERLISFVSDDGRALCYRIADSAGMVKVVVCVDHVFDRLIWPEFLGLGNHSSRPRFMLRGFDQYQMIRKLGNYAVVALPREIPEPFAHFFNVDHCRGGSRRRLSGLNIRGRGEVAGVTVDSIC